MTSTAQMDSPEIRILFIDHETAYNEYEESLTASSVADEGWTVVHVSSLTDAEPKKALEGNETFDLILILWWPDGRHLSLLRIARSIPERKDVPIIMLYDRWFSGQYRVEYESFRNTALENGANACLNKSSMKFGELNKTIRDLLKIPIGQTLRHHWLENEIKLNNGASEDELAAFEAKYNLILPTDFRSYFVAVNGFDSSEAWVADHDLITFHSLANVKPLNQSFPNVADSDSYFVFADFSLSAHVYAVRIDRGVELSGEVVVVDDDGPLKVANNFAEFGEEYMKFKNKRILFPRLINEAY